MGKGEVADRAVPLDGDLKRGGEVLLVLGWDGGRLLPLAEEAVVNECLIGIDGGRISPVPTCTTGACATSFRGKEGTLGIGIPVAFTFACRGFFGVRAALLGTRS